MKIIPTGNHVLVLPDEAEKQLGGLVIPDSAQKKPKRGTVIAVGDGLWERELSIATNERVLDYIKSIAIEGGTSEHKNDIIVELLRRWDDYREQFDTGKRRMSCKSGDKVYYSKFAGTEIDLDGVTHVVLKEYPEILLILPCEEETAWLGTGELKSKEAGV